MSRRTQRGNVTPPLVRDAVDLLNREYGPGSDVPPVVSLELRAGSTEDVLRTLSAHLPSGLAAFVWSTDPRFRPECRLGAYLEQAGVGVEFIGSTFTSKPAERDVSLAIVFGSELAAVAFDAPPADFRVVALMPAFNEEDVIGGTVRALVDQGVGVYLIDNWSTDRTVDVALAAAGEKLVGWERFPPEGRSDTYDWASILRRVEDLALSLRADWFTFHDADERRRPPWPSVDLPTALYRVQRMGFNAVGHTRIDFVPVDNDYTPDVDVEAYFRYIDRPNFLTRGNQIKAWKSPGQRVDLAASGAHAVAFPGRRVFPFHFLLQHYPIRSQAHGEKKVLRERQPRYSSEGKRRGWHTHYAHIREGHSFLGDPRTLVCFDGTWHRRYLIERLTGVGFEPNRYRRFPRVRAQAVRRLRAAGVLPVAVAAKRRTMALLRRPHST